VSLEARIEHTDHPFLEPQSNPTPQTPNPNQHPMDTSAARSAHAPTCHQRLQVPHIKAQAPRRRLPPRLPVADGAVGGEGELIQGLIGGVAAHLVVVQGMVGVGLVMGGGVVVVGIGVVLGWWY